MCRFASPIGENEKKNLTHRTNRWCVDSICLAFNFINKNLFRLIFYHFPIDAGTGRKQTTDQTIISASIERLISEYVNERDL